MTGAPRLVVHVAESAGWAGGEAWLVRVAGAVDRTRFRLAAVLPEPGPLEARMTALGVPVHQVPLAGRLVRPGALVALARVLRRLAPAIVQSHGARTNVYARLAARLAGVPVVISTVHNSLFDYEVGALRRRAYVLAEVATSPLAARVVAVSDAVARDLVRRYRLRPTQVVTVPNGIDADAFVPARPPAAVRAELGVRPGDRLIGVAARMTEQKGQVDLLEALPAVGARVPTLTCVLVGDGPLRGRLEARARALGVGERCRFLGARADVADLLSVLEIVVLPSRSEGLPFSVLEAMALGKPVVATAVGGTPEAVADGVTGRLVPPRDVPALARALTAVLENPEEGRRMGERGARRVREAFGLPRMVAALEEVYASCLARAVKN